MSPIQVSQSGRVTSLFAACVFIFACKLVESTDEPSIARQVVAAMDLIRECVKDYYPEDTGLFPNLYHQEPSEQGIEHFTPEQATVLLSMLNDGIHNSHCNTLYDCISDTCTAVYRGVMDKITEYDAITDKVIVVHILDNETPIASTVAVSDGTLIAGLMEEFAACVFGVRASLGVALNDVYAQNPPLSMIPRLDALTKVQRDWLIEATSQMKREFQCDEDDTCTEPECIKRYGYAMDQIALYEGREDTPDGEGRRSNRWAVNKTGTEDPIAKAHQTWQLQVRGE